MIQTPNYESIPAWCARTGMSRSGTYVAIKRGDLRAIKIGRATRIDVDAGLAWLSRLPTVHGVRAAA